MNKLFLLALALTITGTAGAMEKTAKVQRKPAMAGEIYCGSPDRGNLESMTQAMNRICDTSKSFTGFAHPNTGFHFCCVVREGASP